MSYKHHITIKQVYLLTLMDRTTLLHVKSTILHCPLSITTRKRALVDSKLLGRPRKSVITTYLNDNAQTPLSRFVVYML